jgi:predicted Fe-S protein YdhL (DUF1289 family)
MKIHSVGCHRTKKEITEWVTYDEYKRSKIMSELNSRVTQTKGIGYYGNFV